MVRKYELLHMEEDEDFKKVFSIFHTLVSGLKDLNKSYTIVDHVKKIMRSLTCKTLVLEVLMNSLRSHDTELNEDGVKKNWKFIALKSKGKKHGFKALQNEE